MAKSNYENSVPLGREGTGAAQILGPNRALQQFLGQNERERDRLFGEQQQFQQRQRAYGDAFQKDLMGLSELSVSPMFQADLAKLTDGLLRQGAELRAQDINPYNPNQSPRSQQAVQQWQQEVAKVKQAKLIADNLYKQQQDLVKKYNSNPNSFDIDEFMKVKDFEKNFNLNDVMSGVATMPGLSEIYDLGKGATSQFGEIFKDSNVYGEDPATGQPIMREVREADLPRIQQATNTFFTPGSPAANEVERRLRKDFGQGASISGLLGTTDREEIRSILDNEFRNDTTENNPIAELKSRGRMPSFNSEEYERFLNRAVDEQLKAENVLDSAKQQVANTLTGRVNTKDKWKFDFSVGKEKDRQQAFATSERNKNASYQNTRLSIAKKVQELNDGGDVEEGEDTYIPYGVSSGNEWSTARMPAKGTSRVKIPSARISTTDYYDLDNNGARTPSGEVIEGDIVMYTHVPVVTTPGGNKGVVQENYAKNNPNNVTWEKVALVNRKNNQGAILVPASTTQENLEKKQQSSFDRFMGRPAPTTRKTETKVNTKFKGVPQGGF